VSLTQTLRLVITGDSAGAVTAIDRVGQAADKSLVKAETAGEKMRAGMTKYGAAGVVASGLIGGALVKIASHFETAALAAGRFAEVAGISTENASRMLNVADDLGVSSDDLSAAVGRMGKNFETSGSALAKFGFEAVRSKNGVFDAQATFLLAIERLQKMGDASQRAAAGTAIFGKGWQSIVPLISMGADKLREQFAAVEKSNVFSSDQVSKAKAYQATIANLKDQFSGLANSIGQGAVPVLGSLAAIVGAGAGAFTKLDAVSGGAAGTVATVATVALGAAGAVSFLAGKIGALKAAIVTAEGEISAMGYAMGGIGIALGVVAGAVAIWQHHAQQARKAREEFDGITKAIVEVGDAMGTAAKEGKPFGDLVEFINNALSGSDQKKNLDDISASLTNLGLTAKDLPTVLQDLADVANKGPAEAGPAYARLTKELGALGLTGDQVAYVISTINGTYGSVQLDKYSEKTHQAEVNLKTLANAAKDMPTIISAVSRAVDIEAQKYGTAGVEAAKAYHAQAAGVTTVAGAYDLYAQFISTATGKTMDAAAAEKAIAEEVNNHNQLLAQSITLQHRAEQAIEAHTKAIVDEADVLRAQVDKTYAAHRAQKDYADGLKDFDKNLAKLKEGTVDYNVVLDEQAQKAMDAAQADGDLAVQRSGVTDKTEQAKIKNKEMVKSLLAMQSTLDPNSPLRKQLSSWISDLLGIPDSIHTTISANWQDNIPDWAKEAFKKGWSTHYQPVTPKEPDSTHNAAGGSVNRASMHLVGENGPELFVPQSNGTIVPNGGSITSSAAGSTTIHINVQAPQGTGDPYLWGQKIVKAILDYQRVNGAVFKAA
jgi:hypothetical protein